MEKVKVGDKFKTPESTYTVTAVDESGVSWDCVGRKYWMKKVPIACIEEWIKSGRLVKTCISAL